MQGKDLSIRRKLGYGFGELGSVLFWSSLSFLFMNYLTDEVGLSAGLAGLALMLGKIWDAINDPLVGILSDRTRTPWGRRRPWMLMGALPLGFLYALIFRAPGFSSQSALFFWAAGLYLLLCTAYTTVNIPYISLIPELTKDYDERTNLNGFRSFFSILGTLLGAGAAVPLLLFFGGGKEGYQGVGLVFGVVIIVSALLPVFAVKENPALPGEPPLSFLRSYRNAFRNPPFLRIWGAFGFATAAISVITAVLIYYFKYFFGDEGLLTGALLAMLGCSMLCIPLAVVASSRFGKKKTYIAGLLLLSFSLFLFFLWGHRGSVTWVYLFLSLGGCGLSTHYVLPWSMLPDAVEYDTLRSGVQREGVYFGLWTFISKIGTAFSGLIVGSVLSFVKYTPNAVQEAPALFGIRFLAGPITIILFIMAIVMLKGYHLDRAVYDSLQVRRLER